MAGYKKVSAPFIRHDMNTRLRGIGQQLQVRMVLDILPLGVGVAGMRDIEFFIKTAHQLVGRL